MLYDEPGGAGVFTMEGAESFGFVMNEEDREPVSGSIKKKIGAEDD